MHTPTRIALSLLAILSFAACGSGGGAAPDGAGAGAEFDPQSPTTTVTLMATTLYGGGSGIVWRNGTVEKAPGGLFVGDAGYESRLYVGFFTGTPNVHQVVSATLKLWRMETLGDPLLGYTNGLVAERVFIGNVLDDLDFDRPSLYVTSPRGPVASEGTTGAVELDVTQAVREYFGEGESVITLRVRLENMTPSALVDGFRITVAEPGLLSFSPTLTIVMR